MTSARSVSIFIRPPRPCPSWRRARSRSRSSRFSGSPAGRPSTIAVRPGPWDSPLVVKRIGMSVPGYPSAWAGLPGCALAAYAVDDRGHLVPVGGAIASKRAFADATARARAGLLPLLERRLVELDLVDPE